MKQKRIDEIRKEVGADVHTYDMDLNEHLRERAEAKIAAEMFLEGATAGFPGKPINNQGKKK